MPSVFQSGQVFNGGFRAGELKVSFGGVDVSGFVVQNLNFAFNQQVTTLYEVGSNNVYIVGGRAQGTAAIGRVLGPARFASRFVNTFNDICNPQDMHLSASGGSCRASEPLKSTLVDALLLGINTQMSAAEVVVQQQLQFMYIDLLQ